MKKSFVTMFVVALTALTAFAADSYTVKSVTGKVQFDDNGTMKTVTKGMELSADTKIDVGVGANLVVTKDNKDTRIKPNSKGTVESFATAKAGGIKIGGSAEKNTTAKASTATNKGVATASSRAADVKKDMDFAEDDEEEEEN